MENVKEMIIIKKQHYSASNNTRLVKQILVSFWKKIHSVLAFFHRMSFQNLGQKF